MLLRARLSLVHPRAWIARAAIPPLGRWWLAVGAGRAPTPRRLRGRVPASGEALHGRGCVSWARSHRLRFFQRPFQASNPTVLAHSCSPCASHSTMASTHVAAELSIQVRGAKVLCDGDGALPSEGSLLQIEWQLWLRSQQRTTPNAAPAESCRASFEVHAGTTRRAPNIELQPRPSFQDKSRAGGRRGRRPPWQAAAVAQAAAVRQRRAP